MSNVSDADRSVVIADTRAPEQRVVCSPDGEANPTPPPGIDDTFNMRHIVLVIGNA